MTTYRKITPVCPAFRQAGDKQASTIRRGGQCDIKKIILPEKSGISFYFY
ncbi:MAG: hypothetical protein WBH40_09215 [Ignavibacteriaceae bacterium]